MAETNFASVKLTRNFVGEARREAQTLQRSLGGQIEHWAKLGRAIENSEGFSIGRVREALEGKLKLEALSDQEQEAVFAGLADRFDDSTSESRDYYEKLGQKPGAIGDSASGQMVKRTGKGGLTRIAEL